jgi:hypothetical protein
MADALRNALERNLVIAEGAGQFERAARVRARLAELDKPEPEGEPEPALTDLTKAELRDLADHDEGRARGGPGTEGGIRWRPRPSVTTTSAGTS